MPVKQHPKGNKVSATKGTATNEVPQLFRLNIEVGDLKSAISFYTRLLGVEGLKQAGSRCYFECGPVTLQLLDVSSERLPHSKVVVLSAGDRLHIGAWTTITVKRAEQANS